METEDMPAHSNKRSESESESPPSEKHRRGKTVRDELENLRRMYPQKRGLKLSGPNTPKRGKFATLWVILYDDERASVHASLFEKKHALNDDEWLEFFRKQVLEGTHSNEDAPPKRLGILHGAIIPGTNVRTNKIFRLRAVVGYAIHGSIPSRLLGAWNQTES